MITPSRFPARLLPVLLLFLVRVEPLAAQPTHAAAAETQPQSTGVVYGRVQNSATGQYLNNARVSIKGTDIVAFTDESGSYRLTRVPLGAAMLEVFYTGMGTRQVPVTLQGGTALEQNVELAGASSRDADAAVVKLDDFVVASKPMDGAAIAINEQRFAPNIVNVVSADEFGIVPDGNIGEFLKMLPGVNMSYRGGDPREVFINGAPSSNVPITVGGFSLATSEISGTGRNVELNAVSINNVSRVETIFSPTPESQGSALAGSVNLVPRSAFERRKPELKGTVYLNWRDETAEFHRSKGPRREAEYKVRPGFELAWTVPVNKRFGFTVSAGASTQYVEAPLANNVWRGGGSPTNGTAFPDTTPDKPYLTEFATRVESKIAERSSFAVSADYRVSPESTLSLAVSFGTFHTDFAQRTITFFVVNPDTTGQAASRPVAFDPSFTHGAAGRGEVRIVTSGNNRYTQTFMPTLRYRYKGALWAAESGVGFSEAQNIFRNFDRGMMQTAVSRRTGVTVSFDDNRYLTPGTITVTDGATGAAINPYDVSTYAYNSSANGQQTAGNTLVTAFANAERQFSGRWPFSLKAGWDVRSNRYDNRSKNLNLTYVGADGRASTTPVGNDDSAARFYDPNFYSRTDRFGLPQAQWVDNEAVYELYQSNPGYFTNNANTNYRNAVNASKFSREIISSVFVRGDLQLLERRLKLTGGVRAEQTNVNAQGPLTDPTRNYRRDANGTVLRDAAGVPLPISTDALTVSQLTFLERAAKVDKEYLRLFPSINASYNIRDNLIARAAYYESVGRPDFGQYSGGVTLPDLTSAPSATNRIVVNNAAIKAWQAKSVKVALEYYFERVGLVSVGAFRRTYKNFFGSTQFSPTPAFLDLYGLDEATYGSYLVETQVNLADSLRTEGLEVNYKQALTFLPHWARGIQVNASTSWLRFKGSPQTAIANFSFFPSRSSNVGLSLTRPKYSLRFNANVVARTRQAIITGRGIEAGTYSYRNERSYLEVTGEYSLTKHVALFVNGRNLDDQPEDVEIKGPSTPAQSVFRQREKFGTLWTVGLKATF
jgi:TonB-dependent receptor